MDAALDLLAPDGVLVVTRWLQVPPSEELRFSQPSWKRSTGAA